MLDFAEKIKSSDAVLIVTPEYNGGYPASLKNAIDLLYVEWYHKPVAIATVSDGVFGGTQVITSLQFTLWKMKALMVPALFPVPKVKDAFNENGDPTDKMATDKRALVFVNELLFCIEANSKMAEQKLLLLTFKTYYNHVTSKKREVTFMDTFQNEKSPVKVTLYKGKFLICGAAGN